jgi:hypothetical protein
MKSGQMKVSRVGAVVVSPPGLLMLVSFYSLAIHLKESLGGWPNSIGERGFPPSLITHARVTVTLFELLLLSMILVVPVAMVVCLGVQR